MRGQCAVCAAFLHCWRRSAGILSNSHAEGRWFDPSRDHCKTVARS